MGILWLRNRFYDIGLFKSQKGALKSIVLGNLSFGGTGKTPHIKMIIDILSKRFKMAVLSRGYGRESSGFLLVNELGESSLYGDEPVLLSKHSKDVPVAVCENRVFGLKQIKELIPTTDWVLLDDAFQHRHLKAELYILLTTWDDPFSDDWVLPAGNLRDHPSEKSRADAIVVTKCPEFIERNDPELWKNKLGLNATQALFFSKIQYNTEKSAFGDPEDRIGNRCVIGFAGIAQPKDFENYLKSQFDLKKFKSFPDHYQFTLNDLQTLHNDMLNFGGSDAVLVTTEKDLSRLAGQKEVEILKSCNLFVIPIGIEMIAGEVGFEEWLIEALKKRNGERLR